MKKILPIVIIILTSIGNAHAQTTPATQASQIAQKMKDSLALTDQQKNQIEAASLDIQTIRSGLQDKYKGRALSYYLSIAESNRDSVYKAVLPADKYLLFRQKRATLIGN